MAARGKLINLLPASEFEKSFWGRLLKWAVTTGRRVIILTEMVVIVAFFSRFKLDEDVRSLNSEITGKKNLLQADEVFESEFIRTQKKLQLANQILTQQLKPADTISQIARNIPGEVKFNTLLVNSKGANFTGIAADEKSLGEMLSRLDRDQKWKSIELVSVNEEKNNGVKFVINIYN